MRSEPVRAFLPMAYGVMFSSSAVVPLITPSTRPLEPAGPPAVDGRGPLFMRTSGNWNPEI